MFICIRFSPLLWRHQQQTSRPRTSLGTSWPPPETQQGPPCHLSISEIFWHQTHKLELSGWTWQISKQNRRPNVTSCPQALIYPAIHIIRHAHTNLISILSWAPRILLYVQIENNHVFCQPSCVQFLHESVCKVLLNHTIYTQFLTKLSATSVIMPGSPLWSPG